MPYRLKPGVPLVCVKDRLGKINYHYANPLPNGRNFGPLIPWLSPDRAAYLLRINLVESIDLDADTVPHGGGHDRVIACVEALQDLVIPLEAGAPTIRDALREAGYRFSNEAIHGAVKIRKAALSGTAQPQ